MAEPWRVGPPGSLVALPSPGVRAGIESFEERIGSISIGLDGTRTRDTLAIKRRWKMGWPAATSQTRALLRALARSVWGPLRLIDPYETNRLPADASAGGSESLTADMFTPTAGTAAWVPITDPPAGLPLRGAIAWTRTSTAAGRLAVAADQDNWRVPLITGQQVTLSTHVRGTGGQVALGYHAWDPAGVAASAQTGAVALDPVAWNPLQLPYIPLAGRISLTGFLDVAAGQAVGTVQTTGWQINLGATAAAWQLGGGCPEVFADLTTDNPLPHGLHELELTLLEV